MLPILWIVLTKYTGINKKIHCIVIQWIYREMENLPLTSSEATCNQ